MTKRDYIKPTMTVNEINLNVHILVGTVTTTGLDDDDLEMDEDAGDSWNDAMSRQRNVWSDEEHEEDF